MKMFVVADDFTGANDTGVQFCKKQVTVNVALHWQTHGQSQTADVIVVNTDSRALPAEEAANRVSAVIKAHQHSDLTIYKKTDSTLRGNIGTELEATLHATNRKCVFFCPALPSVGRTIRNGELYINQQRLSETEFATDPKTPIYSSRIREILATQTALPVVEIPLETLRNGTVSETIRQALAQYPQLITVFDAVTDQDLQQIAEEISQIDAPYIIAGSSGLAAFLPESLYRQSHEALPLLFVVASMSKISDLQANHLLEQKLATAIKVDVEQLLTLKHYNNQLIEQISHQLSSRQNVMLKTDSSPQSRLNITVLCEKLVLDRTQLGERICSKLSDIVVAALTNIENGISGLVLTGGDIALGVARTLRADHYRIGGEIENGVPFGYLPQTALQHIPIITKAGGFGSVTVFEKVIDFIRNTSNKEN